jgi:hypothetical protein
VMGETIPGYVVVTNNQNVPSIRLIVGGIPGLGTDKNIINMDSNQGELRLGGNGKDGHLVLYRNNVNNSFSRKNAILHLDSGQGCIWLGGNGKDGDLVIFPSTATDLHDSAQSTIRLNGEAGEIYLGTSGTFGLASQSIRLDGSKSNIWLGQAENPPDTPGIAGDLVIFPLRTTDTADLKQATFHFDGSKGTLWLGGRPQGLDAGGVPAPGIDGEIVIFPSTATDNHDSNQASIAMDGNKGTISVTGDVLIRNADCAEEFDVSKSTTTIDPGTVMVIDDEGKLQKSSKAYDKRVAGVVSGAEDCKPGIILDKKQMSSENNDKSRVPVALVGKVFCKVNAEYSQIKVGDLLTTSSTPGHAMKAANRTKAFGAVIGKALSPLKSGKALIPILIALQ